MRKFNLKFLLALCLLGTANASNAQLHPLNYGPDNWYKDYVGVQLTVTEPVPIAGPLIYTTANNQDGSGDWGGSISTSILDKELVRSQPDSLGCSPAPGPGTMTGKVAFIWRGDCEFGVKALNAEAAGAIAIIIANHSAGGPVGMGAGAVGTSVNIPVFMISLEQGTEINNRLRNGITVKVSFTTWGSGKTNDLAVLPNGISTWHAGAIPLSQLNTTGASPQPYKGYDGAYLANFGSANESDVKLNSVVTFTPTGGTSQVLRSDSVSFLNFPFTDSIVAIGMSDSYDLHATSKGRFDVNYSVSSSAVDEFPANNQASYSFHVTDDVFVKGRYNPVTQQPIANLYIRLLGTGGSSVEYTAGNLYYVSTGGYAAISSIFSLSKDGSDVLDGSSVTVVVYKWKDSLFKDSLLQTGELTPVAVGTHTFGTNDSGGKMYMINYTPADGDTGISGLMLEANTWYFVGVVSPADCFVGMDGITNKLPRTYLRSYAPNNAYNEFYSLARSGTNAEIDDEISNNPGLTFNMFPFEAGSIVTKDVIDSARFANQKDGYVPAISLRIGTTLGVNHVRMNEAVVNLYPNPATDNITATIKLKEKALTVTYNVIDITGKSQKMIMHNNIVDDKVTFSTSGFAAGTYFLVINADNKSTTVRKFAVVR